MWKSTVYVRADSCGLNENLSDQSKRPLKRSLFHLKVTTHVNRGPSVVEWTWPLCRLRRVTERGCVVEGLTFFTGKNACYLKKELKTTNLDQGWWTKCCSGRKFLNSDGQLPPNFSVLPWAPSLCPPPGDLCWSLGGEAEIPSKEGQSPKQSLNWKSHHFQLFFFCFLKRLIHNLALDDLPSGTILPFLIWMCLIFPSETENYLRERPCLRIIEVSS